MSRRHAKARRKSRQLSVGIIHIARRGYGFVDTSEGEYFVMRGQLHGAMNGDLVEVVRLRGAEERRSRENRTSTADGAGRFAGVSDNSGTGRKDMLGSVKRVLERAHATVTGSYSQINGLAVVRPFDERFPDVFIDTRIPTSVRARSGDAVVARIVTYPSRLEAASGYIEEVLGRSDDAGVDIEVIVRRHEIETTFSADALEEAAALEQTAPSTAGPTADGLSRRDLRSRFIFTIDPKDAKDFDDAISLDFIEGRLRLGVHIADVGAYVAWNSALDMNARRRGTSTYLPGRVIPMLPSEISDGLCSLRPGEDKLAVTVDMVLSSNGSVAEVEFYPSTIRSDVCLSYEQAQSILEGELSGGDFVGEESALHTRLVAFNRLAKKLAARRARRGAIEFDGIEAKVVLDTEGIPVEVYLRQKTEATAMIEEAMILANEQVAAYVMARGNPMVYRVHEDPLPLALEELLPTLREFGYAGEDAPQSSKEVQDILEKSYGRPEFHLISTLLLRAMKRAGYASVFTGHYGLASKAYTHFTSPIRRYPDLMAHRLLKSVLASVPPPDDMVALLDVICAHASERERESDRASLEATALKLCEYLEPRCGESFQALITSVNGYGLAVREDSTTADGFIRAEDLERGFVYDPTSYRYHDPDTDDSFRLGQAVRVTLIGVDRQSSRLQFVIA